MSFCVIRGESKRVRHLTLVLEDVGAAARHHTIRKLRLAPADVERSHHVVEKISRDAPGIVPVLAKAEEAIGVKLSLRRLAKPHLPVDKIFALTFRSCRGIDLPVPFSLRRVAMIRALA